MARKKATQFVSKIVSLRNKGKNWDQVCSAISKLAKKPFKVQTLQGAYYTYADARPRRPRKGKAVKAVVARATSRLLRALSTPTPLKLYSTPDLIRKLLKVTEEKDAIHKELCGRF